MNISREEAQQILDALNQSVALGIFNDKGMKLRTAAITLLQSRLTEGEQEPVAWRENKTGVLSATLRDERLWTPLYAAPQGAHK